jgi:DNA-binding response OmpR family regulator
MDKNIMKFRYYIYKLFANISHCLYYHLIMKGSRVLVIEDEEKIAEIVKAYLEKEGFKVAVAETGQKALSVLKDRFDLVILDLMLPDLTGEDICKTIRKDSDLPIIMLTAKSEEEDRIRGLGIGADDYLVKPFSPRELVARVKALLRRVKGTEKRLSFNSRDLIMDFSRFEVTKNGAPLVLTPTEFNLLLCLAERPGQVFTRLQLVTQETRRILRQSMA